MTALFLTVLLASLVGSLHCAGMCGAFVAFAIGAADPTVRTPRYLLLALYQFGRLITYTLLGAAAGTLGASIDLAGHLVGLQQTAAILSGALMVAFGTVTLLRLSGIKLNPARVPPAWSKFVAAAQSRIMRHSPAFRAAGTGLLTTLLPCGWLYAFVTTAAGTGHALTGATLMAVFWLGTLPMLTFIGIGVRKLSGALAAKIPFVAAIAVLSVGLYTIAARANIHLASMHNHAGTAEQLQQQLKSLDHSSLPCCNPSTKPATEGAGK